MNWNYVNLDDETRDLMHSEVMNDTQEEKLYLSKYLISSQPANRLTQEKWSSLLCEAVLHHDTEWLKQQLHSSYPLVKSHIIHRYCDDQFNRFYIRAVCQKAIKTGVNVITYRAHPRLLPLSPEGVVLNPQSLLADLRQNWDNKTELGVPSQPNTGISVKLL